MKTETPKERANKAHKLILAAGTHAYWLKRIKAACVVHSAIGGGWKNHPELIAEVLKCKGHIPSEVTA